MRRLKKKKILTIERKDLEFILSHFEPPALPRRISTHLSRDRQYPVYNIEFMLYKFKEAKEEDCKINAYRYIGGEDKKFSSSSIKAAGGGNCHSGNGHHYSSASGGESDHDYSSAVNMSRDSVVKQIQQRAKVEAAPSLVHIDLDRKNFSSDRTHKNALNKTLTKINEVFLLPKEVSPATVYWSGGGYHILLPVEVDPTKYPVKNGLTLEQTVPGRDLRYASLFTGGNDYRFSASYRLPANLFLWFAEKFLTGGKGDSGHKPSVRSSMVRAPGSYNSKYVDKDKERAEVKILQRWDGHTKAHILFLLGVFYRNVGDDYKKQTRMLAGANKVKRRVQAAQIALERTLEVMPVSAYIATHVFYEGSYSTYAHNKYWYVDRLIQTPVDDFRKRGIDLLLAPFLITIKRMSDYAAEQIMLNWLNRCSSLRPLDFDAAKRVQEKIVYVKESNYLPLGEEKLKAQDPDLFFRLAKGEESRGN
jgi:hypothetical protein